MLTLYAPWYSPTCTDMLSFTMLHCACDSGAVTVLCCSTGTM